jgi:hypothetical protein
MIPTAWALCWLTCLPDVVAFPPGSAAGRAASLSLLTSFDRGRLEPLPCTIGDPGRATHDGRESEDAADLEDESDDNEGSDSVSLPWPFSVGGPSRHSVTLGDSVSASGSSSTHRSAVLRC